MRRSLPTILTTLMVAGALGAVSTPAGGAPVVNGRIAFNSSQGGNDEIFVMNADGSGPTNLTNHPAGDNDAEWSFDGRKLAFTSNRDGLGEIYVMNAAGSGQTNLTNNAANDLLATWSPDGTKIAFVSNRGGTFDIWVMNADGSGPTNLTDGDGGSWPDWSPDGSRIAFESNRDGDYDIYTMNASDGSGLTNVTDTAGTEREAVWSPDGTSMAFLAGGDVHVMNADGTSDVNLTNTDDPEYSPDWSPDGAKIVYERDVEGSNLEILTMNADGSAQTNISNNPESDSVPTWQPVPVPSFSVSKAKVKEGKAAKFRVTLANSPAGPLSLGFETVKGTARRGKDFKPTAGILEFVPGETQKVVKVKTKQDTRDERRETFFLRASVAGVTAKGKAVIRDDD